MGNMKIWRFQDDSTTWTDEKHSSFLEHLEVSFVKQLRQSISFLDQCSNLDERDKLIHPISAHDTSQQLVAQVLGCWEKSNPNRSVESQSHIKRPWVYRSSALGRGVILHQLVQQNL